MKKLTTFIFAFVLCLPILCFGGCKSNEGIKMSKYFDEKVSCQIYEKGNKELTLNAFTNSNTSIDAYTSIKFTGKQDWLYKLEVKYVYFEIYSNLTEEVEFYINITNLKNGNQSGNGGSSIFSYQLSANLAKNRSVKFYIPVNDYFESNSTPTTIEIKPTDHSYFVADDTATNFKYSISNFKLIGNH